jgi:hypothetical protein
VVVLDVPEADPTAMTGRMGEVVGAVLADPEVATLSFG